MPILEDNLPENRETVIILIVRTDLRRLCQHFLTQLLEDCNSKRLYGFHAIIGICAKGNVLIR